MGVIKVEVEIEDRGKVEVIEVEGGTLEGVLAGVRALAGLEGIHVFERDKDHVIGAEIEAKRALSLVAHRCHEIHVKVRYEHHTDEHKFRPSATVFKVLQWAVNVPKFGLDPTGKAKANLMLPGADQPLPKDTVIGRLVSHDQCELTLDLTLKDFTNG